MNRLAVLFTAFLLGGALLVPMSAEAQTGLKVGPRLGIPLGDLDPGSSLFLGLDARAHGTGLPVVPNASIDYYLTDRDAVSYLAIDLNALYEFGISNQQFTPYAGGGLGITHVSVDALGSDTDVGLNLVGGARFPLSSVEPFVQFNAMIGTESERLGLTGGILFNL